MEHVNQTNDNIDQCTFIEEIETLLITKDGISIFVHAWVPDNSQRILICVQGLGGHGGYYKELACLMALNGTIVVAPDLRGHGHSEGVRGDIDRFDRYVMDIDVAVTWAITMWPDTPIFVLGESMGASIAIQYIARGLYQTYQIPLVGLVFVSPVFSSAIRPTFSEVWQSKRKAAKINLPLLVLLGGRDYIARRSGTQAFLRRVAAREQRIVTFPRAYHCLLRDPDTPDVVGVLNAWLIAHHGK